MYGRLKNSNRPEVPVTLLCRVHIAWEEKQCYDEILCDCITFQTPCHINVHVWVSEWASGLIIMHGIFFMGTQLAIIMHVIKWSALNLLFFALKYDSMLHSRPNRTKLVWNIQIFEWYSSNSNDIVVIIYPYIDISIFDEW